MIPFNSIQPTNDCVWIPIGMLNYPAKRNESVPITGETAPAISGYGGTMLFSILKWIHVLSAIVAVGANLTYGIWLARTARRSDVLPFTLQTIKLIDDRIANPAYVLLLITGLAMVFVLPLPLTTPWLLTALVLYVILVLVGLAGYTPTLRRQIQVLDRKGSQSPDYQALARRGTILGIVLGVLAIAIVFLMVVKPGLWA
jgi:uncharacterized membrane protein